LLAAVVLSAAPCAGDGVVSTAGEVAALEGQSAVLTHQPVHHTPQPAKGEDVE